MPLKLDSREYRALPVLSFPGEGERRFDTDYYVEGYAALWDVTYPLYGDYTESIAAGALEGADLSDVIMQYDHAGRVLARKSNGTLIVEPDERGPGPFHAPQQFIEFQADDPSLSILRVLNQEHHEERDDRRACIDE